MKLKFILSLLMLFFLTKGAAKTLVVNDTSSTGVMISMYSNGIKFDTKEAGEDDFRSVFPLIPIVVSLDMANHSIELDFINAIREVEITISQNDGVICSSSENVQVPTFKLINLPSEISGDFFIEIRGKNGAYVYGRFSLY